MSISGKGEDDPSTGSGDGGTLGTPSLAPTEDVPGNDEASMVVSGGGVADTSEDEATAAGDRGLG
jgi:hypothetical protein